MRVLLDESLPTGLAALLSGHRVVTVAQQGWAGMKNGELLDQAGESFDAFITIDANIPHQQSLQSVPLATILLKARSNRLADLERLVPQILAQLDDIKPGQIEIVGS